MPESRKLDEEEKAARAGSEEEEKTRKKALHHDPVPIWFRPSIGREEAARRAGKRRKKVTMRLDKEFVEYFAEKSLIPPFEVFPSLKPEFIERQERFNTILRAEHDERDNILKQHEELGYAEVEIQVTDDEEDEGEQQGLRLGNYK